VTKNAGTGTDTYTHALISPLFSFYFPPIYVFNRSEEGRQQGEQ